MPKDGAEEEIVTGTLMDQTMEKVECNVFNEVIIPLSFDKATLKKDPQIKRKLDMVAERLGLDLRPGAEQQPMIRLPQETFSEGILFPLSRFLVMPVLPTHNARLDIETAFFGCFGHESRGRPSKPWSTTTIGTEAQAQALAMSAFHNCLTDGIYQKAINKVIKVMDGALSVLQRSQDGSGLGFKIDDPVLSHYKAKGKGGKVAKSRSTKEATVMAISGDKVTVKFSANGVRHEVPASWVSACPRDSDDENPTEDLTVSDAKVRLGRAVHAHDLLLSEVAVVEFFWETCKYGANLGDSFVQALSKGNVSECQKIEGAWQQILNTNYLEERIKHAQKLQEEQDAESAPGVPELSMEAS